MLVCAWRTAAADDDYPREWVEMNPVLSRLEGFAFLVIFGLSMIALTAWVGRGHQKNRAEFLVAGRSLGVWLAALSIAASWIWAPALFVASQKAYDQGLPGVFWFTFPNVLSLVLFAPLAFRIRKLFPAGFTLPQLMRRRHGRAVHVLYLIQFLGLQICSFAVQILAGAVLIQSLTGLRFAVVALILVVTALIYSTMGGIRASIVTDFVQMTLILGITAVTVPWVISIAGGLVVVTAGLGGASGEFRNLFDPGVAYSFGIPVTIALLSGPIGDQQHWQRAYALKSDRDVIKAFLLGSLLFVIVPISLSCLGFVAANSEVSQGWSINNSQLVGPIAVSNLLPPFMSVVFSLMLLSGLCSTLDSVLCAVSSLAAVDLIGSSSDGTPDAAKDRRQVRIARISMLALAVLGLSIALIPGLTVVHLFLFYGTWRASTMIPTVLTLFWKRLHRKAVFTAILGSLLLGAPVYAWGSYIGNPDLAVLGSLLVLLIGLLTCVFGTKLMTRESGQPVIEP